MPELKATGSLQPFEKEYFGKGGSRVPVLIGAATFEESGNQSVEAHGGRLWASMNVPHGALFQFTLAAHTDIRS
jgi:hypothetical protein